MGDIGPASPPQATQLPEDDNPSASGAKDIHVMITGFGPFKTNPINPSFLIAAALPLAVTFPAPLTTADPSPTPTPPRQIHFHVHGGPIRVSYSSVRSAVPGLLDSFKRNHNGQWPDIIIHIGMASTRHYYTVETLAHRDGYRITDVDGDIGYEDGERIWKAEGLPDILRPGPSNKLSSSVSATAAFTSTTTTDPFTTSTSPSPPDATFLKTWRSFLPESSDVRLSDDAGRYLCEFIFYTSLSQAWREGRERSVVFLHVPGWTDQMSVEKGRDVTVALVKALVACWVDATGKSES